MKCRKSGLLFLVSSSLVLTLVLAVVMPDRMRQLGKISIARTSQTLAKTYCDDKNNGCYEEDPRRFVNPHPGRLDPPTTVKFCHFLAKCFQALR
ncbi:MAG: hypothetical protein EAZ60_27565 [Oscillatoriales cyanobacterium]|nr:hypothetical protein [Microcoleus sp. PH2017_11_PCY_U_A]MCC3562708.1 hypothetical protein [Microcoleus sp. PH2017_27_LUM_O_A]TAE74508.1 MAG: hypothetical protein EAZ83_30355 [Oscillatoriales cyanobacterium]TAE99529.1 MAG: hypothetical protein EAZ79_05290 [Oscillatoriales cyanobacterium]TAF13710.1 MAG: hypothetical protein EAZ73_30105 [Oscillatoriales cyanobacterium]